MPPTPNEPSVSPADGNEAAGVANESEPRLPAGSFTPGQPASMMSKVLVVLFTTGLVLGGIYVATPDSDDDTRNRSVERKKFDRKQNRLFTKGYDSPFLADGINDPEILPAAETSFAEASPVVGVSVGERHRAYLFMALQGVRPDGTVGSIVNDIIDGTPVTLTHDNDGPRLRVFAAAKGSRRIRLRLAGMGGGGIMRVTFDNETYYTQMAKDLPLKEIPFETTTWSKWKAQHPGSDIFVGEFISGDLQMEATLDYMTATERLAANKVLKERNRKRKNLSPNRRKSAGKQKLTTGGPDGGDRKREGGAPATPQVNE